MIAPIAVQAQDAAASMPVTQNNAPAEGNAILPANTEVLLRMAEEVTTKGEAWKEGDTFRLTVARDVKLGGCSQVSSPASQDEFPRGAS